MFVAAQAQVEAPNPLMAALDSITLEPTDDIEGSESEMSTAPDGKESPFRIPEPNDFAAIAAFAKGLKR